eukprot:TRINITY_DN6197_c0_g3_i1.p1 TRINITY_DN6197_c0_g3~~TRINITY_DN6197_c0_g3_i1.p1  ORF type:complete len:387 (-),score=46.64 TRINITY_DN6197_c0_g3_i1:234-1301(-)
MVAMVQGSNSPSATDFTRNAQSSQKADIALVQRGATMVKDRSERSQLQRDLESSDCPLTRNREVDYFHVRKVVEILDTIGLPYFLHGGTALGLMRFGAISIQPHPGKEDRFAVDNDLDFFVLSVDDVERDALMNNFRDMCNAAGIFSLCQHSHLEWSKEGTDLELPGLEGAPPVADIFDVRRKDDGRCYIKGWPQPYEFDCDQVFPVVEAKYYDFGIPVPRAPMAFMSAAVPWHREQPFPEYGSGCDGLAYPQWLTSAEDPGADVDLDARPARSGSIPRELLKQCARSLRDEGYASFAECFDTNEVEEPDGQERQHAIGDSSTVSKPVTLRPHQSLANPDLKLALLSMRAPPAGK